MKLENINKREALLTESKKRNSAFEYDSVPTPSVYNLAELGWAPAGRLGKYKSKIKRLKPISEYLEDRCWTILYKMGFPHICGEGGAKIRQNESVWNQLDVLAYDDEAAVLIECKSADQIKSKDDLQNDMAKLVMNRTNVGTALRAENCVRKVGAILVLYDIEPTDTDIERARENRIVLMDATAVEYYERLVEHTGSAARYQLLAEVFGDQEIEALKVTLPAVEARIGKSIAYTFAVKPDYLLKVAYVAHRNRGELGVAGPSAYQRLVKKSRLAAIRKFIANGGVFPTNIIVNFNPRRNGKTDWRFEPTQQADSALPNVKLGWLHLPARYQSAWIIDGQHRLLAYSGMDEASKSFLTVTAFDGLDISEQVQMFTTINSEQKKVSGNLLTELYADLKWCSENEEEQVQSIVSKAILYVSQRPSSPFYRRILMADEVATNKKCISLKSVADELRKPGFFLTQKRNGKWVEFGPLWAGTPDPTLKRARRVLDGWFTPISQVAHEIWERGRDDGGYLAMNNGVVVCLEVLRSVFEHLNSQGIKCISLKDEELVGHIEPFARLVGEFFATLTSQELHQLRRSVGTTGQVEGYRRVQSAIHDHIPDFNPTGLSQWLESRADDKKEEAISLLSSIELRVRLYALSELKTRFGHDHSDWWQEIPQPVRLAVARAREKDSRARGNEENYLTYKDIRKIALAHWQHMFEASFAYGSVGNKDKRTEWLNELSSLQSKLGNEAYTGFVKSDYDFVVTIDKWLNSKGI